MAYNKAEKPDAPVRKKGGMHRRKKVCVFCGKDNVIDYKDTNKLKRYVSERGKILPRRITGNCAKHQRALTVAIKRARHIALMPTQQRPANSGMSFPGWPAFLDCCQGILKLYDSFFTGPVEPRRISEGSINCRGGSGAES